MNLFGASPRRSHAQRPGGGYTLTETMVASALFTVVIASVLMCHLGGLRINEFVRPKVENARYARQTLGAFIEEVRCANSVQIGTGTVSSFVPAGPTKAQAGNALRIYPTTNTARFIYYFADSSSATLKKVPLLDSNAVITVATSVTNSVPFTMENFSGSVLTNNQNNAVMSLLLQMRRDSATPGLLDSYQVRARITRRNIL